MAKASTKAKNARRQRTVEKYAEKRASLREIWQDARLSLEERRGARAELARLPRDSNPNRVRNRDETNGRPRAYMRHFGLSRITFRNLAHRGQLPGVRKASW